MPIGRRDGRVRELVRPVRIVWQHAVLGATLAVLVLTGCTAPGPAQWDDAQLREFFGKSPGEVVDTFGQPASVGHAASTLPPPGASEDERRDFNETTESMSYRYWTPDGDLVFHFNLNKRVYAITYRGQAVRQKAAATPLTAVPFRVNVPAQYHRVPGDDRFCFPG
ncbi:MAG: hypothetical protein GX591_10565 [Planctomycetes bacterium]|nr:hypothetical protein [Planctomycetota bacterium]